MSEYHLKRVFFALWPDSQVRDAISDVFKKSIYSQSVGQVYCAENLHLTLHFLGHLTSRQIDCAMQQAANINADKFELLLNGFGCFEKPKILWLGPKEVPDRLAELHEKLAIALGVCHFPLEQRNYQPHVTLMRKFKGFDASAVSQEVLWEVKQFALLESVSTESGVVYKPLKFYSLKA